MFSRVDQSEKKVKRENRCSTELTNQEKVKCGYVFENYLTQQKGYSKLQLRKLVIFKGIYIVITLARLATVRSLHCLHINLDVNVLP